jgi:catechol 2,3-dioxygenase-like lactoylglutathione lyase family enzyme
MTMATDSAGTDSNQRAPGLNAFRPRIAYVTYNVEDVDRALAFYVGVLGMQEQARFPIGGGVNEVVLTFPDSKASSLVLMFKDERAAPVVHGDGYSRFVVRVSDLDGAVAALVERGVRLQTSPTDVGSLRYAMIRDPDGYLIELLQFKRG